MKVGDLVRLPQGTYNHFKLSSYIAVLIKKVPRADRYEYDWIVMTGGRFLALGRQIEQNSEVISESR